MVYSTISNVEQPSEPQVALLCNLLLKMLGSCKPGFYASSILQARVTGDMQQVNQQMQVEVFENKSQRDSPGIGFHVD